MTNCNVTFQPIQTTLSVPVGTLIAEATLAAGVDLHVPCGGQGRCGRCAVLVDDGPVRRRPSLRLSSADITRGYTLACQTVIEGDVTVTLPPQDKIERRLTTDRTAPDSHVPRGYNPAVDQSVRAVYLTLAPPSLADQRDDWSRLKTALHTDHGITGLTADLSLLREMGDRLRNGDWAVTAIVEAEGNASGTATLIDLLPGKQTERLLGAAIDIGTTSNVVYMVDLKSGTILSRAVDYNGQIARGEDVISRIIYAGKNGGLDELRALVTQTLNRLLASAATRAHVEIGDIYKATVAGNSTMIHLFLGIPPRSIRYSPFITAVNGPPSIRAAELGLALHPRATVDCLPGVASYVGSDISAGVIGSGLVDAEETTLFLDIGTNGETVLGTRDWLLSCACSAGPAFEGAGVVHGTRATAGAIEEVWIHSTTYEPTYRVIGQTAPVGLCGSGLIALLAELFITGVIDRSGNLNRSLDTPRLRGGDHGSEYVVAWAEETAHGRDIVLTKVDIDNLLRAKAAIYAGYTVLCQSVGVDPSDVSKVLIGGAFGQYINIEKAVQIGLLPDLAWDRFHFLGNTSVTGAYNALLNRRVRQQIADAAGKMTYLELSADNSFYDCFTSALFLPHTEIDRFPSVKALLDNGRQENARPRQEDAVAIL